MYKFEITIWRCQTKNKNTDKHWAVETAQWVKNLLHKLGHLNVGATSRLGAAAHTYNPAFLQQNQQPNKL